MEKENGEASAPPSDLTYFSVRYSKHSVSALGYSLVMRDDYDALSLFVGK